MADTTFTDGVTLTAAAWFQEVNNALHRGIGLSVITTIASAASPDIFAVTTGGVIDYTGSVTTTGFTAATQAGARRVLVCAAAPTFTAGANMLIDGVASGNSWVARAGDQIEVTAVTTTQFRLVPKVTGMVLLAVATASASATIDFTVGVNSTYDEYLVAINGLVPATDNTDLWCRISIGAAFQAGAGAYQYGRLGITSSSATPFGAVSISDTKILMAAGLGSSTGENLSGEVRLLFPSSTTLYKNIMWNLSQHDQVPNQVYVSGSGFLFASQSAVDGLRFMMSSGNISSGNFALYGLRKT